MAVSLHKSSLTDLELVEVFRSGKNRDAIGILFTRYTHLVFGVCMKYLHNRDESKDAVMQIFEKLHVDLLKHEIHNFKSWLYSVARNHCLMLIRSRKGVFSHSIDETNEMALVEIHSRLHPEDASEKENLLLRLEEGIKLLNEKQRTCIELFYLKEKSYQEVSALTGFGMLEVKSYIQNGKRNLKQFLDQAHAR